MEYDPTTADFTLNDAELRLLRVGAGGVDFSLFDAMPETWSSADPLLWCLLSAAERHVRSIQRLHEGAPYQPAAPDAWHEKITTDWTTLAAMRCQMILHHALLPDTYDYLFQED